MHVHSRPYAAAWLAACLTLFGSNATRAQAPAVGTVAGRVADAAAGTYLGNARVTIASSLETFTDQFGYYRFPAVPAGAVRVRVFYTGFPAQERVVSVGAGQRVTQDFALSASGKTDPDAPVKLDAFVVAAARDMTAAALAVNEQRIRPRAPSASPAVSRPTGASRPTMSCRSGCNTVSSMRS